MNKQYSKEEMAIRDGFAEVALNFWLEEFRSLRRRNPDASFSAGYRTSIARLSYAMADSMMSARSELVEPNDHSDL